MSAIDTTRQVLLQQREGLLAEITPLDQEAQVLRSQLAAVEGTKAELVALLKAVDKAVDKLGQPATKVTRKAAKPCAKQADVMEALQWFTEQNQPIEQPDLEALVKGRLSNELGFSLSGVALRISECLASSAFQVDDSGLVRLPPTPAARHGSAPQVAALAAK